MSAHLESDLHARVRELLLSLVPADGSTVGNTALRRDIEIKLAEKGLKVTEDDYWQAHAALVAQGVLVKGQGRGGSVRRAVIATSTDLGGDLADGVDGFALQSQSVPFNMAVNTKQVTSNPAPKLSSPQTASGRPRAVANEATQIISYRHLDRRVNNPEVGMVTPATDPEAGKARWAYDPHLDPALAFDSQRGRIEVLIDDALASGDTEQMRAALEELKRLQNPYLNWAGKKERTSFEIDTVSLHVHERVDPASILSAVRKAMKTEGKSKGADKAIQPGLFDAPFENLPLRDAIDFYRHERGWANRLIAGDSLLVMNSLLQKESMAGRVQMIFIDPPYGIKYGSNFQPFVGKREVKDRNDADLTQEPEMIKAFRDTWELGIHSYLTYLRDRLLLAQQLLSETGSIFVQISDENLHHVREIMDEVFGSKNFVTVISFKKTGSLTDKKISSVCDYLVWYSKTKEKMKFYPLLAERDGSESAAFRYYWGIDGNVVTEAQAKKNGISLENRMLAQSVSLTSQHESKTRSGKYDFRGEKYLPPTNRQWSVDDDGLDRLARAGRIFVAGENLRYAYLLNDNPSQPLSNLWTDGGSGSFTEDQTYVVQTAVKIIQRCLLMTTAPGDLVLDPTCGSGTTAYVAEKWGRRWITCDTSRVALTLAKQRLMTASFEYYELKYPQEGLKGGFIYKTVPHVTLKSIADNPEIDTIHDRLHPSIQKALTELNSALEDSPPKDFFTITEGVRRGLKLVFSIKGQKLQEWEVPTNFPATWPSKIRPFFDAFHSARHAMQRQIDASITAHADQATLYDQPTFAKNRLRITGPFTVEAVPFPSVKSLDEASGPEEADHSIARTGESGRQHQWRDELLKAGIRGKGGQILKFSDLEPLPTDDHLRHLHATGHLDSGERVVVSFGPEHAALEQRQVTNALNEAGNLFPLPKMIVFCAFTFDPEAAKDIDAIKGIMALKAQMNTDLLTEDLKKAKPNNQSFWLMGQPEVEIRHRKDGQFEVEVHGFDYFDTVKGELVSGGKSKIAMWALDTDYDERSLFPRQVFFPMAEKGEGWEKLKKDIRAELDASRLQAFHGTVSLPFKAGDNHRIAVKIVDDRGIESLKVLALD